MAGTAPTRYRYDVFLSHSSADNPVVRELAEQLRAAGLRVWFDEWLIQPSDVISAKIEEGLEHSAVLLLCMSANAFGSDWVSLEGHTAIFRDPQNLERRFVPLRLDDAPIKAMLRGFAHIDWQSEADRQAQLGRLLQACGAHQRQTGEEAAGVPASSAGEELAPQGPEQSRPPLGTVPEPQAPANTALAQPATAADSVTIQHPLTLQMLHPGAAPLRLPIHSSRRSWRSTPSIAATSTTMNCSGPWRPSSGIRSTALLPSSSDASVEASKSRPGDGLTG